MQWWPKVVFMLLTLLILPQLSFGYGTIAGTVISQPADAVTFNYHNTNLKPVATQNATTVVNSTAVLGVEGLTGNILQRYTSSAAGVTSSVALVNDFINRSNRAVTISATNVTLFTQFGNRSAGTIANWKGSFVTGSYRDVAADNQVTFSFKIKPAANAVNLSAAQTTLNIAITNPSNAQSYTGFNSLVYGGFSTLSQTVTGSVTGPEISVINRYKEVDTTGLVGFSGVVSATNGAIVPGAKVKYVIVVKNIGTATAANVAVGDNIPVHTTFFDIPAGGDQNSVLYKNSGVFGGFTSSANVQAVRFIKTNLPMDSIATFNYAVTVN